MTEPVRRRLWVVSELYYPEQTSTGYFLTRIAEGLAADFDVSVICGQPSYSERGRKALNRESRNGTMIHRMRATHFDKDRLLLRLVNLATLTLSSFIFALRHFKRGDRILVVTNPPSVPIAVGLVARLKRSPATLLVHDVYPEVLAAAGLLGRGTIFYAVLARLFAWTYRLFDQIVVLGRDMEELVRAKLGGAQAKIAIIPNWADTDEIEPVDRALNAFRRDHGLQDKFVVQFSGNIGRTHDVEMLLEAARLVRDDPRIVFLFVGYGGKTGLLAAPAGQPNVLFLPRQPREKLAEMLSASDATVISFVDGMFGLSVPSRMYNVMAAGVPILAAAHPRSELVRTIEESDAGWHVRQGDAPGLARRIRQLATPQGSGEARRRGLAGRRRVMADFRLPLIIEQYRTLFE